MNRNTDSHFGNIPSKDIRRSKFKMPFRHLTSFNTGDIIPIFHKEVLPGDTFQLNESMVIRMTTPIAPVMDNAWIDTYYFFVPRRLLWEHWAEFMGENKTDAWTQETEYRIPRVWAPAPLDDPDAPVGWPKGSIADYMGFPIGVGHDRNGLNGSSTWIDACYFRAYGLIWNEWFRNENISEPCEISLGDEDIDGTRYLNPQAWVTDVQKGGIPLKAVKYADYFTRALPAPQKGEDVLLPLGTTAPIIASSADFPNPALKDTLAEGKQIGEVSGSVKIFPYKGQTGYQSFQEDKRAKFYADLSEATSATINQLRQAFAVQRMAELDARGGTRYIELIASHFGVHSPDARLQRPEYLGGKRVPINIADVVQMSSTDTTTPQGNVAGMSKTIDAHDTFTYSSTEHGIIMGLAVIRTEHSYQQGLDRELTREKKLDFYWPALANLGEQYIKNKEIFLNSLGTGEEAFGYQEAYAEYRYSRNYITGELNSNYATPLDIWHYGDEYDDLPTLSHDWISETSENVARTLAIQDQDQWIADFYFDLTAVRPMPVYSVPSLSSWM